MRLATCYSFPSSLSIALSSSLFVTVIFQRHQHRKKHLNYQECLTYHGITFMTENKQTKSGHFFLEKLIKSINFNFYKNKNIFNFKYDFLSIWVAKIQYRWDARAVPGVTEPRLIPTLKKSMDAAVLSLPALPSEKHRRRRWETVGHCRRTPSSKVKKVSNCISFKEATTVPRNTFSSSLAGSWLVN